MALSRQEIAGVLHRAGLEDAAAEALATLPDLVDVQDAEQFCVAHGLVERTSHAEIPPRVEYRLTPAGRTLEPVLAALADWGRTVTAGDTPAPRG